MSARKQASAVVYKDSHVAVIDLKRASTKGPQSGDGGFKGESSQLPPNFLMKQLANLVTESILCDLSINNGHTNYKIHRIVLTAQSPKYAHLFLEMTDSNPSSEISLTGISQQILEEILEYMYTGEFVFSDSNIEEALNAAIQLDLTKLKDRCISYLHNFNLNNVFKYIGIAIKHQQDELRQKMVTYAQKHSSNLNSTQDFLQSSIETLHAILEKSNDVEENGYEKELGKLEGTIKWLSVNKEQRKEHSPRLLETINFSKFTPQEIHDFTEAHQDIFSAENCVDSLLKAYKFHAISLASKRGM